MEYIYIYIYIYIISLMCSWCMVKLPLVSVKHLCHSSYSSVPFHRFLLTNQSQMSNVLGVYKQWIGLLEWWNSGLDNFCSCFHYLSYMYFVVSGRSFFAPFVYLDSQILRVIDCRWYVSTKCVQCCWTYRIHGY